MVDKGTEYAGTFKKFCKEKDIEVYSTISETKAVFAERAIQSLKHIVYRYIEAHGEKFVPKLQQFVSTLSCRKNRSIGKSAKDVIFYQYCITNSSRNILNQNLKLNFENFELEFRKTIFRSEKVTSHNLQMEFLKYRLYLQKKPPTNIIKDLEKEEILGKILSKRAEKLFRLKVSHFLN